ncbi:hypothetical protein CGLO_04265 [Colletotrichum gloeosporioides Cg-14]|uniref:Uncharacterized protein n=1 Tax=Colletotrichum gloeosporioides (strain Cg-14) TaxID=1237896 RepID=T0M4P0_COLGC|nr:hypothetical protein CGLO_04265 [Colletotrichum gloeosporioides Cg-14]
MHPSIYRSRSSRSAVSKQALTGPGALQFRIGKC